MKSVQKIPDRVVYHRFTEKEKQQLLEQLKELIVAAPGLDNRLILVYLYGSLLRRSTIRDVDLAVYATPPLTFQELLRLGNYLELNLSLPIDLAPLHALPPPMRLQILRFGVQLLPNQDSQLLYNLIVQAYSEINDFTLAKARIKD
jgi:predicted nucleotidyltransferase